MKLRRVVAAALALAVASLLSTGVAFAAAKAAPAGKVNINTATVEQLTTLPGVGPKLAVRILAFAMGAAPALKAYSVEATLLGAGRVFKGEFRKAHSMAVKQGVYTA